MRRLKRRTSPPSSLLRERGDEKIEAKNLTPVPSPTERGDEKIEAKIKKSINKNFKINKNEYNYSNNYSS
jgi:hypothetical protein